MHFAHRAIVAQVSRPDDAAGLVVGEILKEEPGDAVVFEEKGIGPVMTARGIDPAKTGEIGLVVSVSSGCMHGGGVRSDANPPMIEKRLAERTRERFGDEPGRQPANHLRVGWGTVDLASAAIGRAPYGLLQRAIPTMLVKVVQFTDHHVRRAPER